jgi:hypothetical protein
MPAEMALPANQFRYALYLAPPPESDLWRFGCDVIGRDARTGASCDGLALESYQPDSWRSMTSDPRRYDFHATLKAPFPLRLDLDVADLFDRVAEFASKCSPFDAGELSVGVVAAGDRRAFVAMKPHLATSVEDHRPIEIGDLACAQCGFYGQQNHRPVAGRKGSLVALTLAEDDSDAIVCACRNECAVVVKSVRPAPAP